MQYMLDTFLILLKANNASLVLKNLSADVKRHNYNFQGL